MNILTSHTLVVLAILLAVLPGHSVAQGRNEHGESSLTSTPNQPGTITSRRQIDDQVRCFADRYNAGMSIGVDRVRKHPRAPD